MENNFEKYIVMIQNFVPENVINFYKEHIKTAEISPATVGYEDKEKILKENRNTFWVKLDNNTIANLKNVISLAYDIFLKDVYKQELVSVENPQFLIYPPGGKYVPHNDSEDFVNGELKRVVNRDISIIFYMNDDFKGGEIEFTKLSNMKIKPKKGMLLAFPSYFEFEHCVHPVTFGNRYCIVSWIQTENRIYDRNEPQKAKKEIPMTYPTHNVWRLS